MINKIGTLNLLLMLFSAPLLSQIERGHLLNGKIPSSIDSFFEDQQISLDVLRKSTAFLTDRDILTYQGDTIPKRKKAFMRHVKHLSERLERSYQDQEEINPEIAEQVYEIHLLETSFIDKTQVNAQRTVPLRQKIRMVLHSFWSRWAFRYKIPKEASPDSLIPNSPYFHHVEVDTPLHKQFGYLADLKKVDPKKNMVVLFKELSLSGSAPKIRTMDLDLDNEWSLKWGDEVHTDVVGSRIFAALGFDVDHPYFFEKDKLTLVFDEPLEVNNAEELVQAIDRIYDIDFGSFYLSFWDHFRRDGEEKQTPASLCRKSICPLCEVCHRSPARQSETDWLIPSLCSSQSTPIRAERSFAGTPFHWELGYEGGQYPVDNGPYGQLQLSDFGSLFGFGNKPWRLLQRH